MARSWALAYRRCSVDDVDEEVEARAEAVWRQTKPRLDTAKSELRDIARETDPRENPRKFVAQVKQRFLDRGKRR